MKEALVLVTVRFNGKTYTEPGVVFHRHGDQALVAVRRFEELDRAYGYSETIVDGPDYVVFWDQGSQREGVRCQRVSALGRNSYCVVSGPADRLPPPIPLDATVEPTPQMPVHVIGYETDRYVRPRGYAIFAEKGIIGQLDPNSGWSGAQIYLHCTEAPTISYAVLASTSGQVAGFCLGSRPLEPIDEYQYMMALPDSILELLEPQVTFFEFGFESGDTKQVVYEFVAVINDLCQQISMPRLSIHRQSEQRSLARLRSDPPPATEEPPPIDTLPDAITLDLQKQAPSEAFRLQYPLIERYGDYHTWVARFTAANPGQQREYVFEGQLSYVDKSGTKVYIPPQMLEFSIRHREGDEVPAIPGIDGKPIDYPRPVQLGDGTYRITSESTRVDPDRRDVEAEFPQPVKSSKVLASKVPGVGGRLTIALNVAPGSGMMYRTGVPTIPAVFSPDGAWLYLVDANHIIRKISTTDFTEQASLKIGASCTSLGYSRAGLVAAATKVIYVLDPASLKVKHAIATDGVRTIAASAFTGIGFAEGRVEPQEPGGLLEVYTQLLMLDFDRGRMLHRIKNGQGPYFRVNTDDFRMVSGTPYLSKDGRHLYLGGQSKLYQFLVDGEDLIYEQSFGFSPSFMGEGTVTTQKRNSLSYLVYELENADQPRFEIALNQKGPLAVDPKSGSIYFLDREGNMYVFDSTGKQVANYNVSGTRISYLLPHPGGQRLLGWGEEEVFYYDLELGRLAEAVNSRRGDVPSPDDAVSSSPLTGELRPLTPGNLVASIRTPSKPVLVELNPQGEVVQSIDVPKSPDGKSASDIHDLVVAPDGSLYVMLEYNKSTNVIPRERQACVALLGADRKEWRFGVLPNEERTSHGFIGDIELLNSGEAAVLVSQSDAFLLDPRKASDAPTPIPSGMCMTLGPDGTYYTGGGPSERYAICTYDLETLRKTREIETDQEPAAIAVDEEKNLYVARYTTVTKIAPDGSMKQLTVSESWSGDAINDIALSSNGKLAIGSRSGRLFIVDRNLNEDSLFVTADEDLAGWVAWIPGESSKPAPPPDKPSPR